MSRCSKCNKYREEPSLYLSPGPNACRCGANKYFQYHDGNLYPPVRYGDKARFYSEQEKHQQQSEMYDPGEKYFQKASLYGNKNKYMQILYGEQNKYLQEAGENYLEESSRYLEVEEYEIAGEMPAQHVAPPPQPRNMGEAIAGHHRGEDTDHETAWQVVYHHLNWAKGVNPAADNPPAGVRYLRTDVERDPYKITYQDGLLFWGGERMDTSGARKVLPGGKDEEVMGNFTGAFIFAMSIDGEIYAADAAAEYKSGGVFNMREFQVPVNNTNNVVAQLEGRQAVQRKLEGFHHSSFLAGRNVACAGEIFVTNGKLLKVNNNSGHYVPAPVTLLAVADCLKRNRVDVEQVEFGCNMGGGRKFAKINYWKGLRAFVEAKPQWPPPATK